MQNTYSLEAKALVDVKISNLIRRSQLEKVYLSSASHQEPVIQTRRCYLDAWSGETQNGQPVHISYHLGELIITVDYPLTAPDGTKTSRPLTLLHWKPMVAKLMIKSLKKVKARQPKSFSETDLQKLKQKVQLESDYQERREMRAQNGKPRLTSKRELTNWLIAHHHHFDTLRSLNIAGGKARFRIESFRSQGFSQ